MPYIGTSPSQGVRRVHTYTATANQTSFSGAGAEGATLSYKDSNFVDVYQNGVKLGDADYTATSGTAIVLGTGATVSDLVVIVAYDVFSAADTVSKADGGQFDGNVTMAGTLATTGNATFSGDIIKSTSGTSNFAAGVNAGNSIASGGNYNVVVGDEAGTALTTGDNNTAIGFEALATEDTGTRSTALGYRALKVQNNDSTNYNVAIGYETGVAITTGIQNTLVGGGFNGTGLTTGRNNTALGYGALNSQTAGDENTAIGRSTLNALNVTGGGDQYNTAVGAGAGSAVTTGIQNTLLGGLAGDALTDADGNVAIGYGALTSDTKGNKSTAIGLEVLGVQNHTSSTDTHNTAIGFQAGASVTTGIENTLIGSETGDALTVGDRNVAVGKGALGSETVSDRSTAVGYRVLSAQNTGSNADVYNTGLGYYAGGNVTSGIQNTILGASAGSSLTDADYNTAIGYQALGADTKGNRNTAVGYQALAAQNFTSSTDSNNTAVGFHALTANTTGYRNTAIGYGAADATTTPTDVTAVGHNAVGGNTTGAGNTGVGTNALISNTENDFSTAIGSFALEASTGTYNTALGYNSGSAITSGTKNTIIGAYSGNQGGSDIRTSSNNIVISDGDGNPRIHYNTTYGTTGVLYVGNQSNSVYWPFVTTATNQNAFSVNSSNGQLGVTCDTNPALYLNLNNADGSLILFYAQGNNEGNISVSGTTVSFNGGHLSRWSQLSDGTKDTTIVKGTVMTNLDQMAVWKHEAVKVGDNEYNVNGELIGKATEAKDAYTEDNEQLNCMAVSSVEGDVNVAGVFVNWDTFDDGFNDMNIAMTGDMVIRIAKGTTVARGDLLMSAGDGTAKTQGDDIVRSKTIAKVTSTNVSHTYDDGTYLVPCVLMAC